MRDERIDFETIETRRRIAFSSELMDEQIKDSLKIIIGYILLVILWLATAGAYLRFGKVWIELAGGVMLVGGALTAWKVPIDREAIIKETKWATFSYLGVLFLYKHVINIISTVSPSQMGAIFDMNLPDAAAYATIGWLYNISIFVSVMTPIGFIIFLVQKHKVFHGGKSKAETFAEKKGYTKYSQKNYR